MYNYTTPMSPKALYKNATGKCKIGDSIAQNLMLILCTPLGKLPSLPEFGCAIWDLQYELISNSYFWENTVSESLEQSIPKFETRLTNVTVKVRRSEAEVSYHFKKNPEIKEKAIIAINAKLKETGEHYSFSTELFVSPVSK